VLQLHDFPAPHLAYARLRHRYSIFQIIPALVHPIVLGLDRIETASFLRPDGAFQYLTGLASFPDPQTLRRFLLQAPRSSRSSEARMAPRLARIPLPRIPLSPFS